MFVLYETPAGYSLFKLSDTKRYNKAKVEDLFDKFDVRKSVELVNFQPFEDTADAVAAITASQEGKITDRLSKFLDQAKDSAIAVAEKNLAVSLKGMIDSVVHDDKTQELFRGIREHLPELLESTVSESDLKSMQLGLSHALGRYKLKFSADKVDTMVIQGIGLLDDLDKEVNIYAMRVKEWYGWHFPELQAIVPDNVAYSTLVTKVGERRGFQNADLTGVFDDDDEGMIDVVREAADVSMGTDVTELDILHIQSLAEQVLSLSEYRKQLFEYLQNRMQALAPNLTVLTGELVGARLLAHSGSLMNLAKQPASTIQILGAEKALFRALKTKHDTPKYGLIYHASLVGQAAPKHKGKISRVLAAKAALAVRVDALTEDNLDATVGNEGRKKVEMRLRQLEGGAAPSLGASITAKKTGVYHPVAAKTASTSVQYSSTSDVMQLDTTSEKGPKVREESEKKKKKKEKDNKKKSGDSAKKRKHDDDDEGEANGGDSDKKEKKAKKAKKEKKEKKEKK